jgi:HD-GYP domain-containing protein (c-di-GMP phosphodiesterase class II)
MHKRIDPTDVVLGMYIHKLEGNWFSHPFWRARFLLTDPEQLKRLHASSVTGVIIDTELGIDPDAAPATLTPATLTPATLAPAAAAPSGATAQRLRRAALPAPPPPSRDLAANRPSPQGRVMTAAPAEVTRGFGRARNVADRNLKVVTHVFLEMRLGKQISPATVSPVIDSIITSMQSNPFAYNGLLRLSQQSEDVYRHALATSALMIALGRTLGLPTLDLHAAGLAGLLLDTGVTLLPAGEGTPNGLAVPMRPEVWRSHVPLGHDFILRSGLSDTVARACLEHHERFDGGGWPHGTGGNALSKLGRMAAICDAYDLLASGAQNELALDPGQVLRRMKADVGAYDPAILVAFEATVGIWPIGSVVELRSGRLAVVIDQHRDAPDQPLVAAFFAPATGEPIDNLWIDLGNCYGADGIAGHGRIDDLPAAMQASARAALAGILQGVTASDKAKAGGRAARAA